MSRSARFPSKGPPRTGRKNPFLTWFIFRKGSLIVGFTCCAGYVYTCVSGPHAARLLWQPPSLRPLRTASGRPDRRAQRAAFCAPSLITAGALAAIISINPTVLSRPIQDRHATCLCLAMASIQTLDPARDHVIARRQRTAGRRVRFLCKDAHGQRSCPAQSPLALSIRALTVTAAGHIKAAVKDTTSPSKLRPR